ncbi:MAG: hypothetical protein D6705_10415 [Deltaproteobacteria bacterium]|nr:MAG: hypothetical protein D6705_10415 [Deltaproteobacteria bacterium]
MIAAALLAIAACDRGDSSVATPPQPSDETTAPAATARKGDRLPAAPGSDDRPTAASGTGSPATATSGAADVDAAVRRALAELARLGQSAQAKLARHDGPGCLADLDTIEAKVPELASSYAMLRAQCLMEAGHCAEGKERVVAWYVRYGGMTEAGAKGIADQIAARHCRGGDSTVADRVRTALADLADAAYVNPRSPAYCTERLAILDTLAPRLADDDRSDPTIRGGLDALFHTGAACYAHAADCGAAWRTYRTRFPRPDGLSAEQTEKVVKDSFAAAISGCPRP